MLDPLPPEQLMQSRRRIASQAAREKLRLEKYGDSIRHSIELLLCRPLKTQVVSVGIMRVELLHAVVRDFRRLNRNSLGEELGINRILVGRAEIEASIVMSSDSSRICGRHGRGHIERLERAAPRHEC